MNKQKPTGFVLGTIVATALGPDVPEAFTG